MMGPAADEATMHGVTPSFVGRGPPVNLLMRRCGMRRTHRDGKREVRAKEACPCESGSLYGKCCKRRAFKWSKDEKGNFGRDYPLNAHMMEALNDAEGEFRRVLGRRHRWNDPVFLDKFSVSPNNMKKEMLRVCQAAGISSDLIYAFLATDRLPADLHLLPPREAKEFQDARAEYRKLRKSGMGDDELLVFRPFESALLLGLRDVHTVGSYFIERYLNSGAAKRNSKLPQNAEFAIGFFLVNFVKSLHSVCVLLENDISYDAAFLIRSLYENYVRIKYLYRWPLKADFLVQRVIDSLRGKSKSKNENPLPIGHMADELGERDMYDRLYKPVCSMTHAQLDTLPYFLDKGRYEYLELDFEMSTLLSAHELTLRVYDELRRSSSCQLFLKRDLLTVMSRSISSLQLGRSYLTITMGYELPATSASYLEDLMNREPSLRK